MTPSRRQGQVAALLGAARRDRLTGGGWEASNHASGRVPPAFDQRERACLRDSPSGGLGGGCAACFAAPRRSTHHQRRRASCHPGLLAFLTNPGRRRLLPVDRTGVVDLDALRRALRTPTLLVSIMHSNNEVGTLQPIREIADLAHASGALLHADAAQSLGKLAIDVNELGIDLLTLAGHKLYAPKGAGALFVRRGIALESLIHGADHEAGRRAGTENVPYVVALGARRRLPCVAPRGDGALRRARSPGTRCGAARRRDRAERAPRPALAEYAQCELPAAWGANYWRRCRNRRSTGSACHEGPVHLSPVPPHGCAAEIGRGVRLSVGRFTTEDD